MSLQTSSAVYAGGFSNPPVASAHAFRAAMKAMARPGEVQEITGATPPESISPAAGCLLLTLCDPETGVFLAPGADTEAVRAWLAFHTALWIVPFAILYLRLMGWGGRASARDAVVALARRLGRGTSAWASGVALAA